jgi:DNA-binding IclR family transcriptional regulator
VILAFPAVPRRIGEIAQHTGALRGTVRGRVDMLVCTGQAAKVDRGLYLATGRPRAMPDLPTSPSLWRAQPIRDAILAFLDEPRQVQDVAAPIGRPVSNAASHLVAMQRRGLVVRTAHGRYERVGPMLELVRQAAGAWARSGHVDSGVAAADSPTTISAGSAPLRRAP